MLLCLIDGTGEDNDDDYKKSMAGSFCVQLSKKIGGMYYRGPALLGLETFSIAKKALGDLLQQRGNSGDSVYLAGHSRGGAAIIYIAQELQKAKVPVTAMFLYDAVDRTATLKNVSTIPGNVKQCYHARRDASLSSYYTAGRNAAEQEFFACLDRNVGLPHKCAELRRRAVELADQDLKMKRAMRSVTQVDVPSLDFGNCGTLFEPGCRYEEAFFLGSHGAIGGAPIVDGTAPRLLIQSDRAAIASVAAWMSANLIKEGILQPAPT